MMHGQKNIKLHICCSITFFSPKSCRFWDSVEIFSRFRQATDDNMISHMWFACCIIKAADTHAEYVILIAFPRY